MRRRRGFYVFDLVALIVITIALGGLLVSLFQQTREGSRVRDCVTTLHMIDDAMHKHARDNKLPKGTPVDKEVIFEKYFFVPPSCPAHGTYVVEAIGTKPRCTIGGQHTLP